MKTKYMKSIFYRLIKAWTLSEREGFPKESAYWRQNEFKDLAV